MNDYPRQNPAYGRLPSLTGVSGHSCSGFRQLKALFFTGRLMRMLLNRSQLKHPSQALMLFRLSVDDVLGGSLQGVSTPLLHR